MIRNIFIVGSGAFGFTIAKVLGENLKTNNVKIYLYDRDKKIIDYIKKNREHPIFHKNIKLEDNIRLTNHIRGIDKTELLILAVPSKSIRNVIQKIKVFLGHLKKEVIILNLAKGIEKRTDLRISEIINEELQEFNYHYAILSGGMIAKDVIIRNPVFATIASENINIAKQIKKLFTNSYLHIEVSNDVIGTEISGPMKNLIAIVAGICDGQNLSVSSKSGIVCYFARELAELGIKLGGDKTTFLDWSFAYSGDLISSSFGNSRNREFGKLIGEMIEPQNALEIMKRNNKELEGYNSLKSLYSLSIKSSMKVTTLEKLHDIIFYQQKPNIIFNYKEKFFKNNNKN